MNLSESVTLEKHVNDLESMVDDILTTNLESFPKVQAFIIKVVNEYNALKLNHGDLQQSAEADESNMQSDDNDLSDSSDEDPHIPKAAVADGMNSTKGIHAAIQDLANQMKSSMLELKQLIQLQKHLQPMTVTFHFKDTALAPMPPAISHAPQLYGGQPAPCGIPGSLCPPRASYCSYPPPGWPQPPNQNKTSGN